METRTTERPAQGKKSRFGAWAKRNRFALLALFVPMIIQIIGFIALQLWPFGSNTILTIDMYHQYGPFFSLLREKLLTGGSLFYTWDSGVGTNFWGLIGYYLASPLNVLVVLFPRNLLTEAMAVITVLKTGMMGLNFYLFVRYVFHKDGLPNVIFGCMYALCGYMVAYTWNIMWMDALAMLPLAMLGLELMLLGGRPWLYCLALGYAIASNFYIAFMVAVYAVLYFFAHLFVHRDAIDKPLFWKKTGRFALYSLLSGGLAAFMAVPTYIALKGIASLGYAAPQWDSFKFDFIELLASHLSFIEPSVMSGMPNVACGTLALMMIPVYWTGKASAREKIAATSILAVIFLCFNSSLMNYVMHGLRYPNSLDHRFAFLYCFTLVVMAWRGFMELEERQTKLFGWLFAGMVAVIFFAQHEYGETVTHVIGYANVLVVTVYLAILALWRRGKLPRVVAYTLVLFIVGTELVVQWPLYRGVAGRDSEYVRHDPISEVMNKAEAYDEGEFYRLEKLDPIWSSNDCAWFGYKGITQFNSMAYSGMAKAMRQLGFSNNGLNSFFEDSTLPTVNSMLGVRYLMSDKEAESGSTLEFVEQNGIYYVYRNPYALPLGYMVKDGTRNWSVDNNNAFRVQNAFFEAAAGLTSGPLKELKITDYTADDMTIKNNSLTAEWIGGYYFDRGGSASGTVHCTVENGAEQEVYLYIKTKNSQECGSVSVTFADGEQKTFTYDENHVLALGTCPEGDITLDMVFDESNTGYFMVNAVSFDKEIMQTVYDKLSPGGWQIEAWDDTHVKGTVNAAEDGLFFMSIPYDEGWTVKVDGVEAEKVRVGEGFMAVPVAAGTHTVAMSYIPQGFLLGLAASLVSLAVLVLLECLYRRRKKLEPAKSLRRGQHVRVVSAAAYAAQPATDAAETAPAEEPAEPEPENEETEPEETKEEEGNGEQPQDDHPVDPGV